LPAHVQLDDLVHAGVLGLMEALERYDPNKHVEFKSFARFRIQGAILDSLRELDWAPRALRKRGRDLERAHQELSNRLGRPPTEPELAAELRIDLKKLQRLVNNLSGLPDCTNRRSSHHLPEGRDQPSSGSRHRWAPTPPAPCAGTLLL
jgi:RNA polymerase sigma factor for flagellar operon FliA